jgi:large subunit ribosomal protein L17
MRHGVDHRKLGRNGSHRRAMLSNLVASLILEGSIETTVTRAKEVRRVAERIITRAKGGTLNDRRIVISRMNYKEAVIKLFDEVAPRYADRPGGYTRIVRTRFRTGDAAPMAVISLVD